MLARHDCGIDVLPGAPDYGRPGSADAPEVEQAIETLRRIYDFVVVDAGSTLSPCSAAALHVSDEVHLVANPDVPCLRNLQRLRDLVRLAGVAEDRVRYVLNRTSDVEVVPLREIEEVLGRHIDHRFTSDYRTVASALNAGVPLSTPPPRRAAGRARHLRPRHRRRAPCPPPDPAAHRAANSAVTEVVMPPRAVKSPTTVIRRGRQAATRSSRMRLVAAS